MQEFNKKIFENMNIIVLGDVMLDNYIIGSVDRISPEAPVPVVNVKREDYMLGGAGNVCLNLKSCGANPYLFSVIGNDEHGVKLKNIMQDYNIESEFLETDIDRPTTIKKRVVSGTNQLIRIDYEITSNINQKIEKNIINKFNYTVKNNTIDAVIITDYNKGLLTKKLINKIIEMANNFNIPVMVDPKNNNFWEYKNVKLFKPNLKEIQQKYNKKINIEIDSLNAVSSFIKSKLNNEITMITLSEHGIYVDYNNNSFIVPSVAVNISDVSGAGDTVISAASLAISSKEFNEKYSIKDMAVFSNLCAAQVCEKPGVVPVNLGELF